MWIFRKEERIDEEIIYRCKIGFLKVGMLLLLRLIQFLCYYFIFILVCWEIVLRSGKEYENLGCGGRQVFKFCICYCGFWLSD